VRIAVTGSEGFLGWHVRCNALTRTDVELVPIDREAFSDGARLLSALKGTDAVLHLAGANRGDDQEVAAINTKLAKDLAGTLKRIEGSRHVVYANSTQALHGGAYGESKATAAGLLSEAAPTTFTDVVLPNLFGELGRPGYNSFVATFCQRIAQDEPPEIHSDSAVDLLHAQDAASVLLDAAIAGNTGQLCPDGHETSVGRVAELLIAQANVYASGLVPDRASLFERRLFNQLRSYAQPQNPFSSELTRFDNPRRLVRHQDDRGGLVEVAKSLSGEAQTFFSTTKPGVTRGNHFHVTKLERFVVVSGEALIQMRRLGSEEVLSIPVSGESPSAVDIPTLFTHSITNTGSQELLTLFWTDEVFDSERPDTYYQAVEDAS
jgi:UDP-2-acetamido-2,6-beta-L-arabino-hexul-4-ose reductase